MRYDEFVLYLLMKYDDYVYEKTEEYIELIYMNVRLCFYRSGYCGITNMDDDTCIWLRGKIPDEMLHLVKGVIG